MNILELKRRALGHHYCKGDGGGGGGGGGGGDSDSGGPSDSMGLPTGGDVSVDSPSDSMGLPTFDGVSVGVTSPSDSMGLPTFDGWSDSLTSYGGPTTAENAPGIGPQSIDSATKTDASTSINANDSTTESESKGLVGKIADMGMLGLSPISEAMGDRDKSIALAQEYGNAIGNLNADEGGGVLGTVTTRDVDPSSVEGQQIAALGKTEGVMGFMGKSIDPTAEHRGDVNVATLQAMRAMGLGAQDTPGYSGQTVDQALGIHENVAPVTAAMARAIMTFTPMGTVANAVQAAQAISAKMDKGMTLGEAVGDATKGLMSSIAAGKLNQAIAQSLGPAGQVLGAYNKVGSVVNAVSPGSMPGINIGGGLVNAALGGGTGQSAVQGGSTYPSGAGLISSISNGGGSGGASSAPQSPAPVTPATPASGSVDASLYGSANASARRAATNKYFSNKQTRGW